MPFYEYQCRACGALTEVLQRISDAALKKCPECGKNQLTKLISAPVFDAAKSISRKPPAKQAKPKAQPKPKPKAKAKTKARK